MAQKPLAKIESVELRSIFPNETSNLTPWLAEAENIALLSDAIGIDLTIVDREVQVGSFSADLLAVSPDAVDDKPDVVIENQFGETNHDHLGKSITYGAGLGVKKVVWVAEHFRSEHRSALAWLNENSKPDVDFFGVVIRAIKIGNSSPAVEFRVVIEPDGWRRRSLSASVNPRGEMYHQYWGKLIPMLRESGHIQQQRGSTGNGYITVPSGVQGIVYGLNFRARERIGVDLYFDSDADRNQSLFESLLDDREEIEKTVGSELSWEPLEKRKACRVAIYRTGSIDAAPEELDEYRTWMVEALGRLKGGTQELLTDADANLAGSAAI